MTQVERVKLTLNKYLSTWNGKVLRYLHDSHPSKRDGGNVAMEILSAALLPYAMRSFGASEVDYRATAASSVRYLLSLACTIVSDFGLTNVAMQGFASESLAGIGDIAYNPSNMMPTPVVESSGYVKNSAPISNVLAFQDIEYDDEDLTFDDDELLELDGELPSLDAGFRT
jgi:hypothetical protein